MHILSVNRGRAQAIIEGKRKTGIFKKPVGAEVEITPDGVVNDAVCDTRHHGGPDQAIYLYGQADYDWWSEALGRALSPGTFGENLTISGLESATLAIGDRLHMGKLVIEVTAPRIPCNTLATRMDDPQFVKKFRDAERPGAYCRVIRDGTLEGGESVRVEAYDGERVGLIEIFRGYFVRTQLDETTLLRFLNAPIAIRARADYEEQLARIGEG